MNGRLFAVVLIGMEAAAGGAYSAAPVAVSSGMPLSVWTNKAGRVVHDFGQDAFGWANAAGLINGMTETTLAPQGNATRAQAAAILHRFCEKVAK